MRLDTGRDLEALAAGTPAPRLSTITTMTGAVSTETAESQRRSGRKALGRTNLGATTLEATTTRIPAPGMILRIRQTVRRIQRTAPGTILPTLALAMTRVTSATRD